MHALKTEIKRNQILNVKNDIIQIRKFNIFLDNTEQWVEHVLLEIIEEGLS
jgi:hypothetical protein